MNTLRHLAPLLILTACGLGEVRITGVALESPDDKSDPLVDGTVRVLDNRGLLFDSGATDASGRFSVMAPAGEVIYALVENADGIIASFTGVSGMDPVLRVDRGQLHGVPERVRTRWSDTFAGCQGIESGGLVIGQVHVFLAGVDPDETTVVNNATVKLQSTTTGEDLARTACYLDAETGLFDPEGVRTGPLGWYAIPDVPEGAYVLQVEFEVSEGMFTRGYLDIRVPPSGVVPRFPTFVDFPLF